MSIENLLMALPVVLGAILAVAAVRDWLRRRRTQREIASGLDQRWSANDGYSPATDPASREYWEKIERSVNLGNGWEKR